MKLLRDAWATIPPEHRIWVAALIALVVVAAMWFGVLPLILEWLSDA